jgi:dolichyl-phosphate beta-glucosyltransferase
MYEEISVVIPAYNEEKRVLNTLKTIDYYLKKNFKRYEMILVDDGSKDQTLKKALEYKSKNLKVISNHKNRGKGFTVKNGMLRTKYELALFSDSDLATPISEVEKLILNLKKGYDIAIASRSLKESDVKQKQPFHRWLMGKTFALIVSILAVKGFKDTQCGFKLFTRKAVRKIFPLQTFERFSFDVELLYIAKKHGFRIKEVPVTWIDGGDSKVNAIKDSLKMLRDLFIIRLNAIKKKY